MELIGITWYSDDEIVTCGEHLHSDAEFMYFPKVDASIAVNASNYPISDGDLVIFPPFSLHKIVYTQFPSIRYGFRVFSDDHMLRSFPSELTSILFRREPSSVIIFHLSAYPDTARLIEQIHEEYSSDSPYRSERLFSLFSSLLISLYRIDPHPFSVRDEKLEEYCRFIEANFKEKISIDEIANRLYVSPAYFHAKFKTYTGFSPHQYRTLCRISHAKKLLRENRLPLSEIAGECGFSDTNGFIRAFRKIMQNTPAKYREQYHINPNIDT